MLKFIQLNLKITGEGTRGWYQLRGSRPTGEEVGPLGRNTRVAWELPPSQFLQQQKLPGDDKHFYSGHRARVPPSGSSANPAEHLGSGQGRGSGPANERRAASAYPGGSPGALLSTARAWPRPGVAPPREAARPAHPPPRAGRRVLRGRRPRLRLSSSLQPPAWPPADPQAAPRRGWGPLAPPRPIQRRPPGPTASARPAVPRHHLRRRHRAASGTRGPPTCRPEETRWPGSLAGQPRGWRAASAQEDGIIATLHPRCPLNEAHGRVARGRLRRRWGA